MSPVSGPAEGVPGPAGEPGAQGPRAVPARERAVQPHHHVRAGVVPQHAEEAGSAGGHGLSRRRQLQHPVPQARVRTKRNTRAPSWKIKLLQVLRWTDRTKVNLRCRYFAPHRTEVKGYTLIPLFQESREMLLSTLNDCFQRV